MSGRVVVLGSLNLDTVMRVQRMPQPGETLHAVSTTITPGGKGGNQAVAARRAGAEVVFVGAVGPDGDRYLRHLNTVGVDTRAVSVRADTPTGGAAIVVDDHAENFIIVTEGANGRLSADQLDRVELAADDVLLLQFEVPQATVRAAISRAREVGAAVLVNPSPWRDDAADILARADVVIVNENEARALGDDVPAARVCRTLGADGAMWGDAVVPAPRIEPVDTTGAGDAFAGTLAAEIAAGRGSADALQAAVAAASRACLTPGAQQWLSV